MGYPVLPELPRCCWCCWRRSGPAHNNHRRWWCGAERPAADVQLTHGRADMTPCSGQEQQQHSGRCTSCTANLLSHASHAQHTKSLIVAHTVQAYPSTSHISNQPNKTTKKASKLCVLHHCSTDSLESVVQLQCMRLAECGDSAELCKPVLQRPLHASTAAAVCCCCQEVGAGVGHIVAQQLHCLHARTHNAHSMS